MAHKQRLSRCMIFVLTISYIIIKAINESNDEKKLLEEN